MSLSADEIRRRVEAILPRVEKPTRYLGNEVNAVRKDPREVDVRVALVFPDLYEVGMSWPGLQILYHLLNRSPGIAAERAYAVWHDMEREMRAHGVPAFSLETWTPLSAFDVVGFTLQYELCFTNLLNLLDLGGIPLRSSARRRGDPLILAGGPVAYNAEPIAEFLDAVVLGDGEEAFPEICETYRAWKKGSAPRAQLLRDLQRIAGVYVPAHHEIEYATGLAGTMAPILAIHPRENAPAAVRRRFVPDLNDVPFPTAPIVPLGKTVHDRLGIEVQRGCTRACRFCQAGYIYRPERQRSPEKVKQLVTESLKATGYDEVSLLSLSIGDYGCLEPLLGDLMGPQRANGIAVSLPSIRVDTLTEGIIEKIASGRKTGFTMAPEAGSARLRDVINKALSEEQIEFTADAVFKRGWSHVKFYYMIGIPSETDDDVMGIVRTARACQAIGRKYDKKADIHVSTSTFVPKPFTPFQWEPQIPRSEVFRKQAMLRDELKKTGLTYKWHDAKESLLEAVLSRGDRRLGAAVEIAWRNGARFDGWTESYREDVWLAAFEEAGVHPGWYAYRRIPVEEVLPWDHIDCGMEKAWFVKEYGWAFRGKYIPDCATGRCYDCGICDWEIVKNRTYVPVETMRYPQGVKPRGMGAHPVAVETAFTSQSEWLRPYGGIDVARMGKGGAAATAVPSATATSTCTPTGTGTASASDSDPATATDSASVTATATDTASASASVSAAAATATPTPTAASAPIARPTPAASGNRFRATEPRPAGRRPPVPPASLLPEIPSTRYRLRYTKEARAAYLGHLDTMELFTRALKRCGVTVDYSRGFHPQPRLAFGPALMTGAASRAEYVDVDCVPPLPDATLAERLTAQLPDGMRVVAAEVVDKSISSLGRSIVAQTFEVAPRFDAALPAPGELRRAVERFLAAERVEVESLRRPAPAGQGRRADARAERDGGEAPRTTDVRPSVVGAWVTERGDLAFELVASSEHATAKPTDVVRGVLGPASALDRLVLTKVSARFGPSGVKTPRGR